jgi:hypothetical protein
LGYNAAMDSGARRSRPRNVLWWIRFVHTLFWALFAGAIVAIPIVTVVGALGWGLWLSLLVLVEVVVLLVNRMRCPFTGIAARYTDDRSDNFDIFLPAWLARHNKLIFGTLFALGELLFLWRWLAS